MSEILFKNRLAETSSPYLLQHRDNPVHWFPWGREALDIAQQLDRPILLSIGYAACHWCHVMAHESFENESIAAAMNASFINIKVDREERPDIDHLYMSALHALGEQGGWPLTMFLSPTGMPFWGGTYFPPTARYGRPGFPDVLREVSKAWQERRFAIESTGHKLVDSLRGHAEAAAPGLDRGVLDLAAARLLGVMDTVKGGTRGAPKFPNAPLLELFERAWERTGDKTYIDILDLTLTKLCLGGIYDHFGGGLCRYSTDDDWLVPHFEKMLYDNAQLIDLLASAFLRTGNALFRQRIDETVSWMIRDLKALRPAFAASIDADSGEGEGAFYVWTPTQVTNAVGSIAPDVNRRYEITEGGNWEGVSIPHLLHPGADKIVGETIPDSIFQALRVSRETRPHPATDDKLLADWNALSVIALARAGDICERPDWLALATDIHGFICESMLSPHHRFHSYREGRGSSPAMAGDYASMALASLTLHQMTGENHLIAQAVEFLTVLDRDYLSATDGLYTIAATTAADLPLHLPSTMDEAIPNLHGQALAAMVRLAHLTGDHSWLERADCLFDCLAAPTQRNVYGHASILNALDLRLCMVQIIIIGALDDPGSAALARTARLFYPRKTILFTLADTSALPTSHPAHGKTTISNQPTIYVCVGERCSRPMSDTTQLAAIISEMMRL